MPSDDIVPTSNKWEKAKGEERDRHMKYYTYKCVM